MAQMGIGEGQKGLKSGGHWTGALFIWKVPIIHFCEDLYGVDINEGQLINLMENTKNGNIIKLQIHSSGWTNLTRQHAMAFDFTRLNMGKKSRIFDINMYAKT